MKNCAKDFRDPLTWPCMTGAGARRLGRVAALATAVLALGACATSGPAVQSPEVRLSGVELTDFNFRRQTFRLSFDVQNPNGFPLPVRSVRYKVLLDQQQFAAGETDGRFTVPANGSSNFDLSVDLDLVSSASRIASLLQAGSSRPLPYELHGSLKVNIPFTRPLSFVQSGTIMVQ